MFGVVIENIDIVDSFDHLVIVLEISDHDYHQAGVSKTQARAIQNTFGALDSTEAFWNELEGAVFDTTDLDSIFE